MLGDNLKKLRQSRGLSQEEMAGKLNVVRQTVSKWEKGLSVPDSEMLMEIARQFEVPVSSLLGETAEPEGGASDMRSVLEKLTLINEQLARSAQAKRRVLRALLRLWDCTLLSCLLWGFIWLQQQEMLTYLVILSGLSAELTVLRASL